MFENPILKIFFAPISALYGLIGSLRLFLYESGVLKRSQFALPIINVGNLTVGGSGKTPHIEYLIRILEPYLNLGTLSRGYGRKTTGFLEVAAQHTADQSGDEPLIYKRKYPQVAVAVCENRVSGIMSLVGRYPNLQTILLDDAYQHLAVKAGLNILLTEFKAPFYKDFLMPSGRLREWRSGYLRADIIIVTKCPEDASKINRQSIIDEIKPSPTQQVFFSYITYHNPYYIFDGRHRITLQKDMDVILVCGIARPKYLIDYLKPKVNRLHVMDFDDHKDFSKYHVGQVKAAYNSFTSEKKLIITTEKDAIRLQKHRQYLQEERLPVFALGIEVRFHFDETKAFNDSIRNYLLTFQV